MTSEPIRVVVVDDHSMVRSGLRLFLMAFDDLALVGEAANGRDALRVCEQARPDVVLMDLIMPVLDGIHATMELLAADARLRVIGMTSFLEPGLIQDALKAGVSGLVAKDISASDLAKAIRDVRAGQPAFSPQVVSLMEIPGSSSPARPEPAAGVPDYALTPREREVLELIASGASNAEIAERLVVSLSTAKFHVSSILAKMDVSNRAEAVALALQFHLVEGRLPPHAAEG